MFDILFAMVMLLLFSPLFCALAIWVSLDSRGGVFFLQKPVGVD
jgi:lipopolysaccharide/colanic/teichoic acid biosynthesis glycosyltransferase